MHSPGNYWRLHSSIKCSTKLGKLIKKIKVAKLQLRVAAAVKSNQDDLPSLTKSKPSEVGVFKVERKNIWIFEYLEIINRPGVAGAVLQTPSWLIKSVTDPLWKYLQTMLTSKPLELGTWNFYTRFTIPCVSCVT